jgi:hypothetical protein
MRRPLGPGETSGDVMADQQAPAAKPRSRTRLIIQAVVSLVLVVAIFYLLRGSTWLWCGPRSRR